jgi:hypoxanthine phosphoribosyltransferase
LSQASSASSHLVPVITLAEVPALAHELAQRVRAAGFRPELLVYIETGARLVAWELCREFGVSALPAQARRRGHGLKRRLAFVTARLPAAVTSALRRLEERSGVHRRTRRAVEFRATCALRGRAILLVDDAADTGGTIVAVREELVRPGAEAALVRTAVLTATTAEARAAVDFYVRERNSRLPWSSDSPERQAALEQFERCRPAAP